MDPASLPNLPGLLSVARFATYLRAAHNDHAVAARYYSWNIEVAGAFWGPLHVLEISMRNAMQQELARKFRRDDWWNVPSISFTKVSNDSLGSAKSKAAGVARKKARPMVAGDVVSTLMFGFWTGLVGPGGRAQYETKLWNPALTKAFPHYRGSRSGLHSILDDVREFRNRVAHHEPIIWNDPAAMRSTLLQVAGYIDPSVAKFIDQSDRINECLNRKSAALTGTCQF
ncbi:hypothetical protein [Rhodococcus sp. ANT_H53B]|uniref:hypothetical protein n=1 Tax=Rhodococcus sp. ANT_H53B TaxID=2597357 RepID=UPI0011ED90C4|nr:hypothetical protein [Rhodococcus sp. ANT_H53B]KAA0921651.1 hypothetical protein FQ188_23715 [Rhodococcus sp. ANT_H53B]